MRSFVTIRIDHVQAALGGSHENASYLADPARVRRSGTSGGSHARHATDADALTWRDHPNIPKGGQVTILVGDPTKTGEVVVQRLKLPPNYHVPPHIHPFTEYGTVISGSFGAGVGEKFERAGELLKPGSFWMHPAKHPHYGWTGDEGAVVQIHFIGPGGIEYVNPADDPRKKN